MKQAGHSLWRALLMVMGSVLLCALRAQAAADELAIRSPSINSIGGVYVLNAQLQFDVPDKMEDELREGATLAMDLQVRFSRSRSWWRDVQLAALDQHYELQYHNVSERYVLRNLNSGAQAAFVTLTEALVTMRSVDNVPLVDVTLITPDERNQVSLRARLELHTLPNVLSTLLFWHSEYVLQSIWYTWPLIPTWPPNNSSRP